MANQRTRTTLKDIAEEVGLSVTAVSLTLNGKKVRLSEENKQRIREVAARRHYHANSVARSLTLRRTDTFGLLVPDIENPFFASLAKALEESSRKDGKALFIVNSNDDPKADVRSLEMLAAREVDGIFMVPSYTPHAEGAHACDLSDYTEVKNVLAHLECPYVMVDRSTPNTSCDCVSFDNVTGAALATARLIAHGHRRIACIANTCSVNGLGRLKGYTQALEAAGIPVDDNIIFESDYHEEGGYTAAQRLAPYILGSTSDSRRVTAVISCSDMTTLGVIGYFREAKISVPGDCSIISYDNSQALRFASPGITAVAQDIPRLSRCAYECMMKRIENPDAPYANVVLQPELVLRDSVITL
ncbi:MAG: LacI family DNA-binding transcriptional regulator [Atopobiaceae bacterium]